MQFDGANLSNSQISKNVKVEDSGDFSSLVSKLRSSAASRHKAQKNHFSASLFD
jgi:hypothetical protein